MSLIAHDIFIARVSLLSSSGNSLFMWNGLFGSQRQHVINWYNCCKKILKAYKKPIHLIKAEAITTDITWIIISYI